MAAPSGVFEASQDFWVYMHLHWHQQLGLHDCLQQLMLVNLVGQEKGIE